MISEKDDNDEIEIISTHDKKIKLLGEIFSNDSSRQILNLLNNDNELTVNEITQKTNLSLSLVIHHLKKMQSAQLVKVSKVGRSIKGHDMKYYSATNQSFLIVPSKEPMHSVTHSLKKFSKFVAIGLAGFVSWITVKQDAQMFPVWESATDVDTNSNLSVHDEGTIVSQPELDSDSVSADYSDFRSPEPEPQLEPIPEPSHSGVDEFAYKLTQEHANTGSASLDRTVYPEPFGHTSADSVESFVISLIIPILVIVAGIILERLLSRWFRKRKQKRISKLGVD